MVGECMKVIRRKMSSNCIVGFYGGGTRRQTAAALREIENCS